MSVGDSQPNLEDSNSLYICFSGEKTDEPLHYVGSLDDLRHAIMDDDRAVYIVEGELDVWSMHVADRPNTVGTFCSGNIPTDIAAILDELAVKQVVFFADSDSAGGQAATHLRMLLHEASWRGEVEYREFAGPGIPGKGDANTLFCHYYPDLAAACAALHAFPALNRS